MNRRGTTRRGALAIVIVLLAGMNAQADPPVIVLPGPDCFDVAQGGVWEFGTTDVPPIPPDFFGPGSLPFVGPVPVQGGNFSGPDVVVSRLSDIVVDPNEPGVMAPIQIEQLDLRSVDPIEIPGQGQWDVQITLAGPTPGQLQAVIEDAHGGQLQFDFGVQPIYIFTRLGPPFDELIYDPGLEGIPPFPLITVSEVPWTTHDPNDQCAVDSFANGVFFDRNAGTSCAVPVCVSTPDSPAVQLCMDAYAVPPCTPPTNDDCANAALIADEETLPFNTLFATVDGSGAFISGRNVWFQYAAAVDGLARIETCGSAYNTKLAVYDGAGCDPNAEPVATDDNYPECGLGSLVHVPVVAGQTLWIEVGGKHNLAGIGWLSVTMLFDVCDTSNSRRRGLNFDHNHDGGRDLGDLAQLQRCYEGENVPADEHCEAAFNTDYDLDLDFFDVDLMLAAMDGPVHPLPPAGPLVPICPLPGRTTNAAIPGFAWGPCPEPDALYRLSMWRVPDGFSTNDIVEFFDPDWTIEDLTEPQTPFPDNAAPLLPGEQYAWTIEAYDANDPGVFYCGGDEEINILEDDEALDGESIAELLDHLEKIRKELNDEIDDLEDNDLVKEVRLIELLGTLLTGEQSLGGAAWQGLVDFINCNNAALDSLDATKLDTALKSLQALLKLIIDANDDLSPAKKAVLEGLHAQIQRVRDGLDDLSTIKQFTSPDFDVWKYIQDQIKEGLTEAAKVLAEKAIAKIAGKKAAGPIVSIVLDLWNFGDSLFGLSSVSDLRQAWNIIMLKIIEKMSTTNLAIPEGTTSISGYVFTTKCAKDAEACWTISPVVRCWQPEQDGDPGEGEWVDCQARFDSPTGPGSKNFKTEDMTQVLDDKGDPTGECRFNVSIHMDGNCKGPCYVGVAVKVTQKGGKVDEFVSLWGVIPASGD